MVKKTGLSLSPLCLPPYHIAFWTWVEIIRRLLRKYTIFVFWLSKYLWNLQFPSQAWIGALSDLHGKMGNSWLWNTHPSLLPSPHFHLSTTRMLSFSCADLLLFILLSPLFCTEMRRCFTVHITVTCQGTDLSYVTLEKIKRYFIFMKFSFELSKQIQYNLSNLSRMF